METTGRFSSEIHQLNLDEPVHLERAVEKINETIEKFVREGSGWRLQEITDISVHVVGYNQIAAGSYIVTQPIQVARTKAILNIQNKGTENCFELSILAHLHPVDRENNANRMSHYTPYLDELNMTGIKRPVALEQIPKFESQNLAIGINVLAWNYNQKCVIPVYTTKFLERQHVVNLFLVQDIDEEEIGGGDSDEDDFLLQEENGREEIIKHYTLIRNLKGLVIKYTNRIPKLAKLMRRKECCPLKKPVTTN